jgi:hypothetical protein
MLIHPQLPSSKSTTTTKSSLDNIEFQQVFHPSIEWSRTRTVKKSMPTDKRQHGLVATLSDLT